MQIACRQILTVLRFKVKNLDTESTFRFESIRIEEPLTYYSLQLFSWCGV